MSMLFHQFSIIMNSVKDAHLFKHFKGEKKRLKLFTFHLPSRCIIRWVSEDVRFSVLIVVVWSDYDFIHLDKTMMKLLVCRGRCRCRCRWGCSLNTEFRNYRVDNNAKINATTWRLIAIGQFAKSNLVKTTQ